MLQKKCFPNFEKKNQRVFKISRISKIHPKFPIFPKFLRYKKIDKSMLFLNQKLREKNLKH